MLKSIAILTMEAGTVQNGYVGCPHEHDGYDPSDIREFHIMLVRDSCIRCKGTIWPDGSRHDLPRTVTRSFAPYETGLGSTAG